MADYYPLIARAVAGLEKNSGEGRRVLYERARSALVTQLRSVVPALGESDITRERLSLEEAIRKVEAEAARQTREAPRLEPARGGRGAIKPPAPATPDPPPDFGPRRVAQGRSMPDRSSYADEGGLRNFRDVVVEAENLGEASAQASRSARQAFAAVPAPDVHEHPRVEPRLEPERARAPQRNANGYDPVPSHLLEPAFEGSLEPSLMVDDQRVSPARNRPQRGVASIEELDSARGGSWLAFLAPIARALKPLLALFVLVLLIGFIYWGFTYWQRSHLAGAIGGLLPSDRVSTSPGGSAVPRDQARIKIPDRIQPLGQNNPQPDVNATQKAMLYEEDPTDAAGKPYVGTVMWRTEAASPGPGQPPDLVVRATIEIPDRHMNVVWSLRRNTDKSLSASHTIEIAFTLPADFPHGGVSSIPGLLMKPSEQTRGVPLAGQSVKVTTGFFLLGLSAVDSDLQRNVQLLKERPWFDIPIVYDDNRRAILAVEKGPSGERVFADAFAFWAR
jgi:hypothetical protein